MRWIWLLGVACAPMDDVRETTSPAEPEVSLPVVATSSDTAPPATEPPAQAHGMTGFSFIDVQVAGMPRPGSWAAEASDLQYIAEQEIALLVTLTEEPMSDAALAEAGLVGLHLPIEDFHAPTLEQQEAFVRAVRERERLGDKVGVHCLAGLGRTGTMLATWLVWSGMEAEAAITEVRMVRPGSIETLEQEDAVRRFAAALEQRKG